MNMAELGGFKAVKEIARDLPSPTFLSSILYEHEIPIKRLIKHYHKTHCDIVEVSRSLNHVAYTELFQVGIRAVPFPNIFTASK